MIAIIDYGVGNLFSLQCSLNKIGAESVITADKNIIDNADKVILPGVGAFGDAAAKLSSGGLDKVVKEQCAKGKPILGICVGMQLLLDKSYEYGVHDGLGLIGGEVVGLKDYVKGLKIPHIGWNSLAVIDRDPLFYGLESGDYVYFVHSYFAKCDKYVTATTEYGTEVTAAIGKDNVFGVQFHPEKSGNNGLKILKNFNGLKE